MGIGGIMERCNNCGEEVRVGARFCGRCGHSPPSHQGNIHVTARLKRHEELIATNATWQDLQKSWWISGCFNVESGFGAAQDRYYPYCECYLSVPPEPRCDVCGRTNTTSLAFPTGHGDGVYPVFVLEKATGMTTGAIAFFTAEWSAEVEDKMRAPAQILRHAKPVRVGILESSGQVLFSEVCTGFDDPNVTVDVSLASGSYEVIAWIGEVPTLRDAQIEPRYRPIAVGVYGVELQRALDAVTSVDRDPNSWRQFQPGTAIGWQVLSNIVPEWPRALNYNYHDDVKRRDTARAMSWMLQGAIHGDDECYDLAVDVLESTESHVVAYRNQMLAWRGQSVD